MVNSAGLEMRAFLLLILGIACLPAWSGQECVAKSIGEVGKCLGRPAPVRRHIDSELRGTAVAPQPLRVPFDPHLLATQITNSFAMGEVVALAGSRGNEWMLQTHDAKVDGNGKLEPTDLDEHNQVAWIRFQQSSPTPTSDDEVVDPRPVIEVKAIAASASLLPPQPESGSESSPVPPFPKCVSAERRKNKFDSAVPYDTLTGNFRLLRLSSRHRVIAAEVTRTEGYAGGGGTFTGEVLLDVRDGKLVPIACYALSRYQIFGGAWNPDGTREHPESFAAWRLVVIPGGKWPKLRLRPTSSSTSGTVLSWDQNQGIYTELARPRRR